MASCFISPLPCMLVSRRISRLLSMMAIISRIRIPLMLEMPPGGGGSVLGKGEGAGCPHLGQKAAWGLTSFPHIMHGKSSFINAA